MAKSASKVQGTFSFLDEVEKSEPLPTPKRNTLRPPEQVELKDEAVEPQLPPEQADSPRTIPVPTEHFEVPEPAPEEQKEVVEKIPELITGQVKDPGVETHKPEKQIYKERESLDVKHKTGKPASRSVRPSEIIVKKAPGTRGRRSVKEYDLTSDQVTVPDDEVLFSKQYYSMGEVTTMLKENHSLIRYWESEFDILKPRKNGKGDRFFRPLDVKNLYLIYDLLRRRKFTIEGAREYLRNQKKAEEKFATIQSLQKIKNFFLELKANL